MSLPTPSDASEPRRHLEDEGNTTFRGVGFGRHRRVKSQLYAVDERPTGCPKPQTCPSTAEAAPQPPKIRPHAVEQDQSTTTKTMAETVFAMVQRQEQERREAIARGEPDPFLIKEPEEPAREPNRLERFEEWMATDWEFGPYYWEEGQERPESLKERCRQRFWWLYEKNLRGAEFVGEVVANLFGLTESKYQWVIDAQRDEERREKQRKLEDSQRRMLAERALAEREATEQAARRAEGDVEH